jgi:hypothetical protein
MGGTPMDEMPSKSRAKTPQWIEEAAEYADAADCFAERGHLQYGARERREARRRAPIAGGTEPLPEMADRIAELRERANSAPPTSYLVDRDTF